ncbi:MAG: hypothetical protein IPL61_17805 [Myxococcales bacterium]|nr:hypothetical protein [Myxococcales bacterium]
MAAIALLSAACKKQELGDFDERQGGMEPMGMMFGAMESLGALVFAPFFVFLGYWFVCFWDRREDRPSKGDTQLGTKLILWSLILAAAMMIVLGGLQLVSFILGGFKGGSGVVKSALATIVSGAAIGAPLALLGLPRTNNAAFPQIERFALGLFGFGNAMGAAVSLTMLINAVFFAKGWRANIAPSLSALLVMGAAAGGALWRHGMLSGWSAPTADR